MTRAQSVANSRLLLMGAVVEKNWPAIDVAHQRLSAILLEALIDRASDEIDSVKSVFAEAFAKIVLLNDLEVESSPERAAWSLNSAAIIAGAAAALIPALGPSDQTGAAERILQLLDRSNIGRLTSKDLAEQCNIAEETVSRTLPKLISQNKIRSWKSGRARFSEITAFGREHIRKSEGSYGVNDQSDGNGFLSVFSFDIFRSQSKTDELHVFGKTPTTVDRSSKNDTLVSSLSEDSSDEARLEFLVDPLLRPKGELMASSLWQNSKVNRVGVK